MSLPEAIREQIIAELIANQKIAAIKIYRDATQSSLMDAKTAVEEIERQAATSSRDQFVNTDGLTHVHIDDLILNEIFQGRILNAVQIYHDSSEASLQESKAFVEGLSAQLKSENPKLFLNPKSGSGCTVMLLIVALAIGGCLTLSALSV